MTTRELPLVFSMLHGIIHIQEDDMWNCTTNSQEKEALNATNCLRVFDMVHTVLQDWILAENAHSMPWY